MWSWLPCPIRINSQHSTSLPRTTEQSRYCFAVCLRINIGVWLFNTAVRSFFKDHVDNVTLPCLKQFDTVSTLSRTLLLTSTFKIQQIVVRAYIKKAAHWDPDWTMNDTHYDNVWCLQINIGFPSSVSEYTITIMARSTAHSRIIRV